MKFFQLFVINSGLTLIVIGNAFLLKKQFFPSVTYVIKSKPSIAIISLEAILILSLYTRLLIKIFFDKLTASELENLTEKFWPILMDTCLSFAIFNKKSNYVFSFRLLFVLFLKCFHILANSRTNLMGHVVQLPLHFHIRMIGIIFYLGFIDVFQITTSFNELRKSGLSIEVMFAFEFTLLIVSVIHILGFYVMNYIEMRSENGWDEKVVYAHYLELMVNFVNLVSYIALIIVLSKMRHIPIFLLRSFVHKIRELKTCLIQVFHSRRAIARLNSFPNPTQEDLTRDSLCAVCRDEMQTIETAKKLVCRHVFHITCLKDWLRRQQTCPTCRSDVINAVQTHPNIANNGQG